MTDILYYSGCLMAMVEKSESRVKLIDLTEAQDASDLQVCLIFCNSFMFNISWINNWIMCIFL